MNTKKIIATAILLILIAYLANKTFNHNPGICPYDTSACYFTSGYYEARGLFREKAQKAGATLISRQIKNN